MAEVLSEPGAREKQRSRESLTSDTVKYESGADGGEEVSMSVEWNGVSTVQSPRRASRQCDCQTPELSAPHGRRRQPVTPNSQLSHASHNAA